MAKSNKQERPKEYLFTKIITIETDEYGNTFYDEVDGAFPLHLIMYPVGVPNHAPLFKNTDYQGIATFLILENETTYIVKKSVEEIYTLLENYSNYYVDKEELKGTLLNNALNN